MCTLNQARILLLLFVFVMIASCQKEISNQTSAEPPAVQMGKPSTGSTSIDVIPDYNPSESDLSAGGWSRIFLDDFSTTVDQSTWNIWYGGAYNNELQLYKPENLVVNNGNLEIQAKNETVVGPTLPGSTTNSSYDFTSGRIESKTLFSASTATPRIRMLARIKLPSGYGMWPAFWSYGDPWPTQGEIDIMEAKGDQPYTYSVAYWYGRRAGGQASGGYYWPTTNGNLQDYWHVYEVIWEKNALNYYIDGHFVRQFTGSNVSAMFGKKQKLTLNLAVGGSFFNNPPASSIVTGTMLVDWVRVYTKN